jgi:hypothetical protein
MTYKLKERACAENPYTTKITQLAVYSNLLVLMKGKRCTNDPSFGCEDDTIFIVEYRNLEMCALCPTCLIISETT